MQPVAQLGSLMAMDGTEDKLAIMKKKVDFDRNCQEAQEAIMNSQHKERQLFKESIERRLSTIQDTFSEITNAIADERKQEIESNVKAVMNDVETQPSIEAIKLDDDIDIDEYC